VLAAAVEELVSALGDVVVEELAPIVLVSEALPLVAPLLLVASVVCAVDEELVSVLALPEVWAIARPTPPANAAAAASVVRLFLVEFISVLLDMKALQGSVPPQGEVGRKMLAGASCFSA
jgi:hypothetical protein